LQFNDALRSELTNALSKNEYGNQLPNLQEYMALSESTRDTLREILHYLTLLHTNKRLPDLNTFLSYSTDIKRVNVNSRKNGCSPHFSCKDRLYL
jgi:hypothetical protein